MNSADAIDYDFMTGKIVGNVFKENGNDAIDTSGSTTLIKDNYVDGSGDKCISVGEGSQPLLFNNLLIGCETGIAVKDSSRPLVMNCIIARNRIGVNSYQKKVFFGGGHSTFINVLFSENERDIVFDNLTTADKLLLDASDINITYSNVKYDGEGNTHLVIGLEKLKENDWIAAELSNKGGPIPLDSYLGEEITK